MQFKNLTLLLLASFGARGSDAFAFHSANTPQQLTKSHRFANTPSSSSRHGSKYKLYSSTDSNNENESQPSPSEPIKKIQLTNEKIAEMLEVTFIKACFQLATGHVDVLKLFLAAVNAAYDAKTAIPKLIQSVADCPTNTANRQLSKEELELRSNWMTISYLTLETIDRLEGKKNLVDLSIPDHVREKFGMLVEVKVRKNLSMAAATGNSTDEFTTVDPDPQAAALMAYNIKVIELMLSNVEEARFANEKAPGIDEDAVGPPRPNIPGAYTQDKV
jgi:hypothetical protein